MNIIDDSSDDASSSASYLEQLPPPQSPVAASANVPAHGEPWVVHDVARLVKAGVSRNAIAASFPVMSSLFAAGVPSDDLTMAFHEQYWAALKITGCGVPAYVKRGGRVLATARTAWLATVKAFYLEQLPLPLCPVAPSAIAPQPPPPNVVIVLAQLSSKWVFSGDAALPFHCTTCMKSFPVGR